MIAPMKRAFVMMMEREKKEALHALRRLGSLHVEPLEGVGGDYDELSASVAAMREAIGLLSEFKAEKQLEELNMRDGLDLANRVRRLDAESKAANDEAAATAREIERIRPWGDFDPSAIAELSGKGIPLRLVELSAKKLEAASFGSDFIRLGEAKGSVRLAVIAGPEAALPSDCVEFRLPAKGLSELEAELIDARSRASAARQAMAAEAPRSEGLKKALARVERDMAFEALRSGMSAGDGVSWLAAWVPAKEEKRLSDLAAKEGWGLLLDDPLEEEQPPTKIE
nr:hypothetical protein [Spirochaetales bacterium]